MSKARSDSVLKTLPPERQADIAAYAGAHSIADTVAWLKADGLKTSSAALSRFLSSYAVQQQVARNEATVAALLENISKDNPDWTPEQIQQAGQSFFTALALQQQDPAVWVATQRLSLDRDSARARFDLERQKLAHAERKIVLLEKKAAAFDQAKDVMHSTLSPEEQRQRLKEILK